MIQMFPGKSYIRILPVAYPDNTVSYLYCDTALVFDGLRNNGIPIFHLPDDYEVIVLPKEFLDGRWRPASITRNGPPTQLTLWAGRKIKRISPASDGDRKYLGAPVRLVTATKYHVTIINPYTLKEEILDVRFANPSDWELV